MEVRLPPQGERRHFPTHQRSGTIPRLKAPERRYCGVYQIGDV